jgi:hypothetical protein
MPPCFQCIINKFNVAHGWLASFIKNSLYCCNYFVICQLHNAPTRPILRLYDQCSSNWRAVSDAHLPIPIIYLKSFEALWINSISLCYLCSSHFILFHISVLHLVVFMEHACLLAVPVLLHLVDVHCNFYPLYCAEPPLSFESELSSLSFHNCDYDSIVGQIYKISRQCICSLHMCIRQREQKICHQAGRDVFC